MDKKYVFIFVREDLSFPVQIVQSCHAVYELGKSQTSNNEHFVHCTVSSEELDRIEGICINNNLNFEIFYEPDNNLGYTSLATIVNEVDKKIFKKYNITK